MSDHKHTCGPWTVKHDFNVMGQGNDGIFRSVCSTGGYDSNIVDPTEENISNANLIAAAPELLEALKELSNREHYADGGYYENMVVKAERAIKKALGEHNESPDRL